MTETRCPLPKMARIRQTFARPRVDDMAAEMREQMQVLPPLIRPGMTVGLTVGSRGIQNILTMLEQAASCLTEMASENVYLAAIGPDMELTIIMEEDALQHRYPAGAYPRTAADAVLPDAR